MDLTQLANLGEFVGGVAVVVTLAYLALQVRQGTSQAHLSAANAMIGNLQNAMLPIYDHFDVWDQGLEGVDELSDRDRRMFSLLMLRVFHALQNSFYQQREGALATDWYRVHITAITAFTGRSGGMHWWDENRDCFTSEFRDLVDEIARVHRSG